MSIPNDSVPEPALGPFQAAMEERELAQRYALMAAKHPVYNEVRAVLVRLEHDVVTATGFLTTIVVGPVDLKRDGENLAQMLQGLKDAFSRCGAGLDRLLPGPHGIAHEVLLTRLISLQDANYACIRAALEGRQANDDYKALLAWADEAVRATRRLGFAVDHVFASVARVEQEPT